MQVIQLIHSSDMKALVISRLGGPEVLEIQQVPQPVANPGEVLVKAAAGGVNFADIMTAQGGYPSAPSAPLIAGREFAGVIERTGKRVMGYTQWAAFAECVAARHELLWPVPDNWGAEEAAAFPRQLFHRLLRLLESRAGTKPNQRGEAARADPCGCGRSGHSRSGDRENSQCGDVWHVLFR